MAGSTNKKVIITRFDREPVLGFVNPQTYLLVEGVERAKIVSVSDEEGFFRAAVRTYHFKVEPGPQLEALVSRVSSLFEQYVKLAQSLNYDSVVASVRTEDPDRLADSIAWNLQVSVEEKQELLEIIDPGERLTRIAELLEIEIEKLNVDRLLYEKNKTEAISRNP